MRMDVETAVIALALGAILRVLQGIARRRQKTTRDDRSVN